MAEERPRARQRRASGRSGPASRRSGRTRRRRRSPSASAGTLRWLRNTAIAVVLAVAAGFGGVRLWAFEAGLGVGRIRLDAKSTDPQDVGQQLEQAGLVSSAGAFAWYVRLWMPFRRLEAGSHWLPRDASPELLARLLARQAGRPSAKVLIAEGMDAFEIGERLQELGVCTAQDFVREALRGAAGGSGASAEGYLFPATYQLGLNSSAASLVARFQAIARGKHRAVLSAQGTQLSRLQRELGWSSTDVINLAALVQREAAGAGEFAEVAGVFLNRLRDPSFKPRGMLQSDPSAAYGCKLHPELPSCHGFAGRVSPAMLRDAANPFNTYRHRGLPPGPIGNPGVEAIAAVLTAPATESFFFVLGPDGRHIFSRTLEEHRRAIRRGR